MRSSGLFAFALVVAACAARNEARPPPSDVHTTPPVGTLSTEQPPPAERPNPRIREGAVDDIVVGAPIPTHHLDGQPQYHARWVADAQPMEGFLMGTPPVWVILEKGPMDEVEPGPVEELTPKLAPLALAAARAGMPVGAILVEQPGIVTAAGIGVGSSYESLRDAYGEIDLLRSPEWLDTNITCDATTKTLSGVRFLLESCEQGQPPGRVKRVFVTRSADVGPAAASGLPDDRVVRVTVRRLGPAQLVASDEPERRAQGSLPPRNTSSPRSFRASGTALRRLARGRPWLAADPLTGAAIPL